MSHIPYTVWVGGPPYGVPAPPAVIPSISMEGRRIKTTGEWARQREQLYTLVVKKPGITNAELSELTGMGVIAVNQRLQTMKRNKLMHAANVVLRDVFLKNSQVCVTRVGWFVGPK